MNLLASLFSALKNPSVSKLERKSCFLLLLARGVRASSSGTALLVTSLSQVLSEKISWH